MWRIENSKKKWSHMQLIIFINKVSTSYELTSELKTGETGEAVQMSKQAEPTRGSSTTQTNTIRGDFTKWREEKNKHIGFIWLYIFYCFYFFFTYKSIKSLSDRIHIFIVICIWNVPTQKYHTVRSILWFTNMFVFVFQFIRIRFFNNIMLLNYQFRRGSK